MLTKSLYTTQELLSFKLRLFSTFTSEPLSLVSISFHQQSSAVPQHRLHDLSEHSGHVASSLFETLLQDKEADRVNGPCQLILKHTAVWHHMVTTVCLCISHGAFSYNLFTFFYIVVGIYSLFFPFLQSQVLVTGFWLFYTFNVGIVQVLWHY